MNVELPYAPELSFFEVDSVSGLSTLCIVVGGLGLISAGLGVISVGAAITIGSGGVAGPIGLAGLSGGVTLVHIGFSSLISADE